ncbi:endonuclease MutS2 [Clostridia bacterium]|nr:endonuclease MutS2 [Clostridia bacterium]
MDKEIKKTELDKILQKLSEYGASDLAKEHLRNISPLFDIEDAGKQLKRTEDAFALTMKYGGIGFAPVRDVTVPLERCERGATLTLRELLDIGAVLRQASDISRYGSNPRMSTSLDTVFEDVDECAALTRVLREKIEKSVESEDALFDDASEKLSGIRRALRKAHSRVRESLEKLVKGAEKSFLQDRVVTQRDGRYVVPVKQEYRNSVPGLLHDVSGSGQTLFIEPIDAVNANNEIRQLLLEERDEILRITKDLSERAGTLRREIEYGFCAMTDLEVVFAKAAYGSDMKGAAAVLSDKPLLKLRGARHPLIAGDKVVPVSLTVGEEYRALVITGPNTGGKTAALKTAGLLTLMTYCGLMIPVSLDGETVVGSFDSVLTDLGDGQSITENLSTFSAHMLTIRSILERATPRTLVLLDELGSGTDPAEGGALAVAILSALGDSGSIVIATTHYREVKLHALRDPLTENACCEFDIATLRPTYKIIQGVPGKSYALDIARRLDLPPHVIELAKDMVSGEDKSLEDVFSALTEARKKAEEEREEAEKRLREIEMKQQELERRLQKTAELREGEINAARSEAMAMIAAVEQQGKAALSKIEELRAGKNMDPKQVKSALRTATDKMRDTANPVADKPATGEKLTSFTKPPEIGDQVAMAATGVTGTVTAIEKGGVYIVQFGNVRTKMKVTDLAKPTKSQKRADKAASKPESGYRFVRNEGAYSETTRLGGMEADVRGMSADEMVFHIDKFIDESVINGYETVTVIHGKGSGVLRDAAARFLRGHKHVKSFRAGEYGEGDAGVTVVTLC